MIALSCGLDAAAVDESADADDDAPATVTDVADTHARPESAADADTEAADTDDVSKPDVDTVDEALLLAQ